MKNLVLHEHFCSDINFLQDAQNDQVSKVLCALDQNNSYLYVMFNNELYVIICDKIIRPTRKLDFPNVTFTNAIALEYCMLTDEIYCAYESGHIISIKISVNDKCKYNTLNNFTTGLKHMTLSPDNEIISIVTGTGMLVLMLWNGRSIKEINLYSTKPGKKELSNVGWGKKETQFHGSAGKAAAKTQQKQLTADESDEGRTLIAWQDDGKMFTVNFLHPETKLRLLKTFDREGTLLYTSESIKGCLLDDCLAWKPLESRIAVTTKTKNNCYVTYYEKNGLKYKDFIDCQAMLWSDNFDSRNMVVKELLWSPTADILAIFFKHRSLNRTMIQLWTEHNGHSYLKQTIGFPDDTPLLRAMWITGSTDNKNTLILLSKKKFEICSFNWCVNHSRGKTIQDLCLVGVIDANKLHITSLQKAVKPPPASHCTLEFKVPINAIVFAPDVRDSTTFIDSSVFCVITYNNIFSICRRKTDASKLEYEIFKTYGINAYANIISYDLHHFCWFTENFMLCSLAISSGNCFNCFILENMNSREHSNLYLQAVCDTNALILHIISFPNMMYAYIVTNHMIYRFSKGSLTQTDLAINELCYHVDVMQASKTEKQFLIFLTHTNRLIINKYELSKNILSFFVHTDGMIFTTLQHQLICIPFELNNLRYRQNEIDFKEWSEKLNVERSESKYKDIREIERGAYVILAIPNRSQIILQMPRGNLETVEIKILIVRVIMRYLDECNYMAAFEIMRKHHVNLNLLYDHNPYLFIENVEKFVDQFANVPICLSVFLSTLKEEDVTKTLYTSAYSIKTAPCVCKWDDSTINVDKVSNICILLNVAMEKRADVNKLACPIIQTLLKGYKESGLKMALNKLKQLLSSENDFIKALKYLLNSVDINLLYDTALSTYDIELAMFIVSKSQKDPKEYIPFLNSLQVMDENYMKYTIDMHLKRYESALEHIAKDLDKFDKCLNLVCKHKLYKQALKLFKRNTEQHDMIAARFGEHLLQNKMYHEAATMFHRCGNLLKASEIFTLAGSWENAVITVNQMNLSPAESNIRYLIMVKHLSTNGKYIDAATILLHYLNDPEQAIALLCDYGRSWKHAMRIAYDVKRPDLADMYIKPGIQKHADFTISHLSDTQQEFLKHKSRLAVLRSRMDIRQGLLFSEMFSYNKLMTIFDYNPNATTNKKNNGDADMPNDTISIADTASTMDTQASTKSVKSYRSSKSRRKQERKLLSLKEGSMFEDFGLINALYHIIANTYKNIDEWRELLEMLVYFEYDETAEKLQSEINNFFRVIQESKLEIWNKFAPTSLDELRAKSNYTIQQLVEIAAPVKPLYKFVTFPPETDVPCLDIV